MRHSLYTDQFFESHAESALRSARVIAPIVMSLVEARRVVDIGCGRGAWLRAFAENGAAMIRGFDGGYVDRAKLYFDPSHFTSVDLRQEFAIGDRYDVAICLEVVEHLPRRKADRLVGHLTKASDIVLFSAAIPGQPGTGHVNARWPAHWIELFGSYGFKALDAIRPLVREDKSVDWWYRQNIMLFCNESALDAYPKLRSCPCAEPAMEWIHVGSAARHFGPRNKLRRLPAEVWLAMTERLASASKNGSKA